MKLNMVLAVAILAAVLPSCKKNTDKPPHNTPTERTVKYAIFTSKDYSNDNSVVTIKLRMLEGNTSVWDSVLAPIALKNLPSAANKLVIEKKVPGNNNATLSTGFYYTLQNVGYSWYYEQFFAGEQLKTVSLNF